jgi:hypothetical protein
MLPDSYYREIDMLTELRDASIGRLSCAQVLDREAFGRYREAVAKFLTHSKGFAVIPKRALQLINTSATFCKTASQYSEDRQFVDEFGAFMDRAFFCLVGGEDLDDRQPGVPRII